MTTLSLTPLDVTLFGWPEVSPATPLEQLGLLVGAPLVVFVLVFAIAKGNAMMKASKHGPGPQASDPVWMGGRARSIMGGAEDELPGSGGDRRRELERSSSSATPEEGAGGASARW